MQYFFPLLKKALSYVLFFFIYWLSLRKLSLLREAIAFTGRSKSFAFYDEKFFFLFSKWKPVIENRESTHTFRHENEILRERFYYVYKYDWFKISFITLFG